MSLTESIPAGATVTIDSAPIIYLLDGHRILAPRFFPLFEAIEAGRYRAVVSAITLAEVLAGPLKRGREALVLRYRRILTESPGWTMLPVDAEIAEAAARFRLRYGLKLPDAIQLATAVHSGSAALVTHDRDFSAVREIPVFTGG